MTNATSPGKRWSVGKAITILALAIALPLGGAAIYFIVTRGLSVGTSQWTGVEIVTIMLGVVSVILSAVTIALGILAIWGFAAMREAAVRAAETAARSHIDSLREGKMLEDLTRFGDDLGRHQETEGSSERTSSS